MTQQPAAVEKVETPPFYDVEQRRTLVISGLAIIVGIAAVGVARLLIAAIALVTNVSFHGRFSVFGATPTGNHLGIFVVFVPVIGGVLVGLLARYGSGAIRGHGIPEAMEQILINESKISPKVTVLKPLSAAIAIGTGGPFGAEGPIIATGGALGSLVGQLLHTTPDERKTLLAAGAAAGMAAIFGTPVAAVLLAIELLLFEYRPRSLVPVALASATATGIRMVFEGSAGVFAMPMLTPPSGEALTTYMVLGAIVGVAAVFVTRSLYYVEEAFEKLPVHWMWWPAIGAIVVGVIGYFEPRTLGVGYDNISNILAGNFADAVLISLVVLKFVSWSIALGSGTSGGTLAPLFTIGGGLGALLGIVCVHWFPGLGVDPRIAALVGMAAIFAGASRALLTSVVFAFETTRQPIGLLPLLGGCTAAFIISSLMMRYTIMTEKLARRGTHVPTEYLAAPPGEVARRDAEAVRRRHFDIPADLGGARRDPTDSRTTEIL
ncbi:MAG: chloride channel protein [Gemmatimonadota bacterium]|nr:chloride channel protein [Gemmatimonadota bacterium]